MTAAMGTGASSALGSSRPAAARWLRRVPIGRVHLPLLGLAALLTGWELVGRSGALGGTVPSATAVVRQIQDGRDLLLPATRATVGRAGLGGLIGLLIGMAVAAVTALFPHSHSHVERAAVLVNAVPVVALGPILMSLPTRTVTPVIFAAASVFFTTVLTATDGFRAATSSARDVFRTLGARRWQTFVRLQLPGAVPFVADAVRLAVPAALLGAILGEWFGANSGLGLVMVSSMRNVQVELLWAATVMAVAVSLAFYALGTLAERAATRTFGRPATVRRSDRPATRPLDVAVAISLPLVLIGGWQWWVSARDVPAAVAPTPRQVLDALVTNWHEYLHAAGLTLVSSLGGLVCGALVGVGLAIVSVLFGWIRASASAITLLIPTIPIVVFIPIIGSIAGYGMSTVLICCVLMAFFPVYVIVLSGLGARPAGSDDLFRVYGANRFVVLARLAIPASLPSMFLALRLSAANCVLIALSSEWLMDVGGLGRIFSDQQVTLNTGKGWAAVVVAIVLSVVAYRLAALAERWAASRWS